MDPIHQDDKGWWFWDETWAYRYGPFQTEAEARVMLDRYAAVLDEDPEYADDEVRFYLGDKECTTQK